MLMLRIMDLLGGFYKNIIWHIDQTNQHQMELKNMNRTMEAIMKTDRKVDKAKAKMKKKKC